MRLLLPLFLLITACAQDETVARYGGAGQVWVLSELDGAAPEARITLTFPDRGQIAGQAPCNSYSARQIAPYPWFEAPNITTTKRACPTLALETRYLDALRRASQSEALGDTLILSGDGPTLVFTADG